MGWNWGRLGLVALQVTLAETALLEIVWQVQQPALAGVNYLADYLPALALRSGGDPLADLIDLGRLYAPAVAGLLADGFVHPSPHPPLVNLVFLPLTYLPYETGRAVWIALSAGLAVWTGRRVGFSWLGSAAILAWPPLLIAVDSADWEIVLLALAVAGWHAAAAGRPVRAGLWLGLAAGLKFYPGLFLLPFLARRQWRTVGAAVLAFAGCQVANLLVVGPAGLWRFYVEVLPGVARWYYGIGLNVSPYGAALRLFGGASDVPPALSLPWLALPVAVGIALLAIGLAWRTRPEAAGLLPILVMPTAWEVYAVLGLPALAGLWRDPGRPRWLIVPTLAASFTLMALMSTGPFSNLVRGLGVATSLGFGVLGAIQAVGCLALLVLATRRVSSAVPAVTAELAVDASR